MVTTEIIRDLLTQGEGESVEFKERYAPLSGPDEAKAEFLKDMVAFANARRQVDAFVLVGVRHTPGGGAEVVGQDEHPDQANLQQFLDSRTNRSIRFEYHVLNVDGKRVGVYRILKDQARPIYLKNDYKQTRGKVSYVRRGSSTDVLTPDEIAQLAPAPARGAPWPAEHGKQIKGMVDRWFRLFDVHRAQQQQIPDLLSQFTIPLDMLTDWRDAARLLQDRELRRATCRLFNVTEDWLDTGRGQIYHPVYLHTARLDRISGCLEENLNFGTDGDLLVFQDGEEPLAPPYRRWAALLLRVHLAWFAEVPVHRYTTFYIDRWEDAHERKRAKLVMLAAQELGFNINGYTLKRAELESLRSGEIFPDELMPTARGRWTAWHVVADYETPDMAELIEVRKTGEDSGFLPAVRRLEAAYRNAKPSYL